MSQPQQPALHVELITPAARRIDCKDAAKVFLPSELGEIGVLPGHTPLMGVLATGRVRIERPQAADFLAVSGGVMEIQPDRVRILAETAEPAKAIDVDRAAAARDRAEKRLAEAARDQTIDVPRAQAALARATNRLHVAAAFHDATVDNQDR